jgi:hypothetical protein
MSGPRIKRERNDGDVEMGECAKKRKSEVIVLDE